jgi:hypothetical protein
MRSIYSSKSFGGLSSCFFVSSLQKPIFLPKDLLRQYEVEEEGYVNQQYECGLLRVSTPEFGQIAQF